MGKPVRNRRGRQTEHDRKTQKTRKRSTNTQISRRRQHQARPRWHESEEVPESRRQTKRSTNNPRARRKRTLPASRHGSNRMRLLKANKNSSKRNPDSRIRGFRSKPKTRSTHNLGRGVSSSMKAGSRKRTLKESENNAVISIPSKKARMTCNVRGVALSLSHSNVQGSDESILSNAVPRDNLNMYGNPQYPRVEALTNEWAEIIRMCPAKEKFDNKRYILRGNPIQLRSKIRCPRRNDPAPEPRPEVSYDDNEDYLNTEVNKSYVYNTTTKSITSTADDPNPFGRTGFFDKQHQTHYFALAMKSEIRKTAMKALNNPDLFLTEVNFQYTLGESDRKYLAGRWRGSDLVEIFKPKYIVVGLKCSDSEGEDPKLLINGCFPLRDINDEYWVLRGALAGNAVYNINYAG